MKLTTILAATIPLLATTSALPGTSGAEGGRSNGMGQWGTSQGNDNAKGPPAGGEGNMPSGEDGSRPGQKHQRDLDIRAAGDYMIEECDGARRDCKQQAVIMKGKTDGLCIPALRPGDYDGTIHILDRQVMCTYYEKVGCDGQHRGPWTSGDKEYTLKAYEDHYFVWKPESYICSLFTFGDKTAPVTRVVDE